MAVGSQCPKLGVGVMFSIRNSQATWVESKVMKRCNHQGMEGRNPQVWGEYLCLGRKRGSKKRQRVRSMMKKSLLSVPQKPEKTLPER